MKFNERIIYLIVIAALAFGWLKWPRNSVKIETIPGDSIPYNIIIEKPVPYDTIIYDTDTLWLAGDTVKITDTVFVYNDYFKMYNYKVDTLVSEVNVSINSQVTQNRLYRQDISILNNRETKIISDQSNLMFIGMSLGDKVILPEISYLYKNNGISIGYNIYNNSIVFGYKYKIHINKLR